MGLLSKPATVLGDIMSAASLHVGSNLFHNLPTHYQEAHDMSELPSDQTVIA